MMTNVTSLLMLCGLCRAPAAAATAAAAGSSWHGDGSSRGGLSRTSCRLASAASAAAAAAAAVAAGNTPFNVLKNVKIISTVYLELLLWMLLPLAFIVT
jgi:hypothetical protein